MKLIFLIVGLGNPGPEYALTRHNIGFLALDAVVHEHHAPAYHEKFHGQLTQISYTLSSGDTCDILCLKPMTFMNVSGKSVQAVMQFYKIPLSRVLVIHDDLELTPSQIKLKRGGGHGGHNGLKHIDQCVGKDYMRLRLGIGHPGHKDLVTPYVLGSFQKSDKTWLEPLLVSLADMIPKLCEGMSDTVETSPQKSEKPQPLNKAHIDWLNTFHMRLKEEEARI